MNSGKHLVLFSPGFPKNETDWYCIPPLQGFVQLFRQKYPEWKLSIIALHYPYQAGEYEWHGIKVLALGGNNRGFPMRLWLWRKALNQLKVLHHREPITVLHSFWMQECALLGQRFTRKYGMRHVCTVMGQDAQPTNRYLNRISSQNLNVVAISQRAGDAIQSLMGSVPSIIPWGLDALGQQSFPEPETRKRLIIGVGNLVPVKRWDWFLEVVALLKKGGKADGAILIGGGPAENKLREYAKNLNLGAFVQFAGHMDRPEILQKMREGLILLHTAESEGQGYVFLEAQAQGLVLVSTPVGMANPSDRWKMGQNPNELAEACIEFLGQMPTPIFKPDFCMEETVNAYMEIYQA